MSKKHHEHYTTKQNYNYLFTLFKRKHEKTLHRYSCRIRCRICRGCSCESSDERNRREHTVRHLQNGKSFQRQSYQRCVQSSGAHRRHYCKSTRQSSRDQHGRAHRRIRLLFLSLFKCRRPDPQQHHHHCSRRGRKRSADSGHALCRRYTERHRGLRCRHYHSDSPGTSDNA